MTKKTKRISVGLGLFLVFALAAGGAYAYWTNTGTGSGNAATDNPAGSQLSVAGDAITGLAPGVAAQTLEGTITNNGSSDAYVTGLSASITIDATHDTAGCKPDDYTLVSPSGVSGSVTKSGGTMTFSSGSIEFNNKATAQDFCKGATVTINYTVS